MTNESTASQAQSTLIGLSQQLATVVAEVGQSVVRVDDGTRLTATGLIWTAEGLILTTSHGVERDEELAIELADGTRLPATVTGRDPEADLALLQVAANGLPAVQTAGSDEAQVGHLVLALGRPGNLGLQATLGIVSARLEAQSNGQPEYILHTDANLYPGFSGGPLVNLAGQVVGLINLSLGRGQGVALGIPILTHVIETLKTHGMRQRGYLGVSTQATPLQEALKQTLGITQEYGLLVVQVASGSPAEQGGLLVGDILLGLGQNPVQEADALRHHLRAHYAGQDVDLQILRGGQRQDLTVTLGAQS